MSIFEYEQDFDGFQSGRISPSKDSAPSREKANERWFNCKNGFFFVPRDIRLHEFSNAEFRVLVTLGSFVFQRDRATPGLKKLSEYTGMSEGTISKATSSLEKKGWLRKEQRPYNTVMYHLTLPEQYKKQSSKEEQQIKLNQLF